MLNSAGIHQKTASVPAYNNLYAYASNNPIKYTDPDGNFLINTNKDSETIALYNKKFLFAHKGMNLNSAIESVKKKGVEVDEK